jgi:hypothetical protein
MNIDDVLRSIYGSLPESLKTFTRRTKIFRIASGNMVSRGTRNHRRNLDSFAERYGGLMRDKPSFSVGDVIVRSADSEEVKAATQYESAGEIFQNRRNAEERSVGVDGFSGMALDDAMFDSNSQAHVLWSNAEIVHYISELAFSLSERPAVVEFGCGAAHQFYFFREFGIQDYVGLDGNPYFIELNRHLADFSDHFKVADLQRPVRLGLDGGDLKFDLVTSFEVLEHIDESHVPTFIESMKNHLKLGGVLLCTASLVDGLDVHVTVKTRDWWGEKFESAGFKEHERSAEIIDALTERHPSNWNGSSTNVFALVHQTDSSSETNDSGIA